MDLMAEGKSRLLKEASMLSNYISLGITAAVVSMLVFHRVAKWKLTVAIFGALLVWFSIIGGPLAWMYALSLAGGIAAVIWASGKRQVMR